MTGIQMRKEVIIPILLLCLLSVYAFGFFFWPYMPKDVQVLNNIYYISIASVVYGMSIVIFILAAKMAIKIISCIWLAVSGTALYNELFSDPTNWTWWSLGLIIFVAANLFLTVSIIEKTKSKNGNNNNHK